MSPPNLFLVPGEGFEPPRETHTPLKRTRLPIPPARHAPIIILCERRPLRCAYRRNVRYVEVRTKRTAVTAVTRVNSVSRGRGP